MPLRRSEIRVGTIAYFDHSLLLAEPAIDKGDEGLNRPGPFVCVEIVGEQSVWCAITGVGRPERLFIENTWRRDGSDAWLSSLLYLQDGLATYLGPSSAFIRAAINEHTFFQYRRPWITKPGMQAILAEIDRQGGQMFSQTQMPLRYYQYR